MKGTLKECMLKDAESPRSSTHDGEDQKLELVRKVAVTKAWKPRACLASLVSLKAERRASEHWMLIEAAIKLESESCGIITARYWLAFLRRHVRGGGLAVKKQVDHQDPLCSRVPSAKRYLYDKVLADDVNALLGAHPRWGGSTPRLPSARQTSERRAAWWECIMDANAWWLAESISPINAAMLLSCRNPNVEKIEDAETNSSDEMEPQDFRRLKNIFEGADKERRTLKNWTAYARERGLKIHSWINEWEAWVLEVDARQLPRPRVAGVVAEIPDRKRKHYLHDLFMVEKSKCSGPNDLWARLLALAKTGSSQLIGVTEKGIQYLDAKDAQQEFSKKQLDAYMNGTNLTRQRPPKRSAQVSLSQRKPRKSA